MAVIRTKYDKTKVYDTPLYKDYKSVQQIFSVVSIDESGIMELPDKKYSAEYILSDINFIGLTEKEQKTLIMGFARILKTIPCRFSYTVANERVNDERYNETIIRKPGINVDENIIRSFNEDIKNKVTDARQGLCQTIYLTLTIEAKDIIDARTTFLSIESAVHSAFVDLGINGRQGSIMRRVGINERMQQLYDFTHMGLNSGYKFDFESEIKSSHDWLNTISPASVMFENEDFIINGVYGKVMYIDKFANTLESDILSLLSGVNCVSYITVNQELLDISGLKQEIGRKHMAVGMKIENEKARNRNNNDYLADASSRLLSDIEKLDNFIKEIDVNDDHYFNTTVMIMFMAKSKAELRILEDKFINIAGLKSLKLKSCFGRQKEGINSTFPFGIQEFKRVTNFSSSCLAMFMPFKTQEIYDKNGTFYGINQISQNAIFANKKKEKNRNTIYLGQSGSGKSMISKMEMIYNYITNPDDVFVIMDLMREYVGTSDKMIGSVVSVDATKENFINPCDVDFKDVDVIRLREIISDKADFILTLLASCLKREISAEEQGIIDGVIEKVYSENYAMRKRLNGELETDSEFEVPEYMKSKNENTLLSTELTNEEQIRAYSPVLQDIYQGLLDEGSALAKELANGMEIFVNGSLNLFNHRTNVDLSNRFIVFDLSGLKENLKVTSMLVILENIKSMLNKNSSKGLWTHLYIDEFHELLGIPQVAEFVLKLWKKVRKMKALVNGITQNMSDMLNNDNGGKLSAILSNTECFVMLSQSTIDKNELMKFLPNISPAMFSYVDNAASGTGLLKIGALTVPFDMRISKNSEIYKITNTDGGSYGL